MKSTPSLKSLYYMTDIQMAEQDFKGEQRLDSWAPRTLSSFQPAASEPQKTSMDEEVFEGSSELPCPKKTSRMFLSYQRSPMVKVSGCYGTNRDKNLLDGDDLSRLAFLKVHIVSSQLMA